MGSARTTRTLIPWTAFVRCPRPHTSHASAAHSRCDPTLHTGHLGLREACAQLPAMARSPTCLQSEVFLVLPRAPGGPPSGSTVVPGRGRASWRLFSFSVLKREAGQSFPGPRTASRSPADQNWPRVQVPAVRETARGDSGSAEGGGLRSRGLEDVRAAPGGLLWFLEATPDLEGKKQETKREEPETLIFHTIDIRRSGRGRQVLPHVSPGREPGVPGASEGVSSPVSSLCLICRCNCPGPRCQTGVGAALRITEARLSPSFTQHRGRKGKETGTRREVRRTGEPMFI